MKDSQNIIIAEIYQPGEGRRAAGKYLTGVPNWTG